MSKNADGATGGPVSLSLTFDQALELADHAYLIETGRIVMSGSADEIANNEDVRKSYLGY